MSWIDPDPFDLDPLAQVGDADARRDRALLERFGSEAAIMAAFRELMAAGRPEVSED